MKQVQKINLSALHNEEAFGFFSLVKEEMKSLPADPTEGNRPGPSRRRMPWPMKLGERPTCM